MYDSGEAITDQGSDIVYSSKTPYGAVFFVTDKPHDYTSPNKQASIDKLPTEIKGIKVRLLRNVGKLHDLIGDDDMLGILDI